MTDITLDGLAIAAQETDLELFGFSCSGLKKIMRLVACFQAEKEKTDLDVIAERFRSKGFRVVSIKYRIEQNYVDTSQIFITFAGE